MIEINKVYNENCLDTMKKMEDNSVDAIVTDPPYGLSFMGKKWDYDVPSVEIWQEALRVLKPGGYLLAFAGTRTQHRMAVRIEDAGFEIRDMIAWVYASGFPKSLNIGKAIDKLQGNEREILGIRKVPDQRSGGINSQRTAEIGVPTRMTTDTKGTSEWEGWGTALKPALEPITVARKPLSEKTVAENCLKWGVGGINIDGCRVEYTSEKDKKEGQSARPSKTSNANEYALNHGGLEGMDRSDRSHITGRFPANFIHDGSEEVVDLLGSASRFFYCAKASKSERNEGCEELDLKRRSCLSGSDNDKEIIDDLSERFRTTPQQNNHPTVKPIALMEYLIKLVSRKGAIVFDPFTGSGSTLIACVNLGRSFIGVELSAEYCEIANKRITEAQKQQNLF